MRVLIADDHELLRDTLALFLHTAGICAQTVPDLAMALDRIAADDAWDLVLLDLAMPGMNGLDGLRRALQAAGDCPVALISGTARPETAEQAMAMGAAGVLEKTLSAAELIRAVRLMAEGGRWAATAAVAPAPRHRPLTPREMQVLEQFCLGRSNREIAGVLDISEPTVKLHARTLCRKLGAANRTQAAMIARETGLF